MARVQTTIRGPNGDVDIELTPTRAIKAKCMDCSNWQRIEVKECWANKCPLYPFRGWISLEKREMTEEQREAARASLLKARQSKMGTRKKLTTEENLD